jgi:hypothetical protein
MRHFLFEEKEYRINPRFKRRHNEQDSTQRAQAQMAQQTLAQNYDKLDKPTRPGSPAEALFGQGVA